MTDRPQYVTGLTAFGVHYELMASKSPAMLTSAWHMEHRPDATTADYIAAGAKLGSVITRSMAEIVTDTVSDALGSRAIWRAGGEEGDYYDQLYFSLDDE